MIFIRYILTLAYSSILSKKETLKGITYAPVCMQRYKDSTSPKAIWVGRDQR